MLLSYFCCYLNFVTSFVKLFLTLVRDFKLLTDFTKNSILGVTGVLDPSLENYNMF